MSLMFTAVPAGSAVGRMISAGRVLAGGLIFSMLIGEAEDELEAAGLGCAGARARAPWAYLRLGSRVVTPDSLVDNK